MLSRKIARPSSRAKLPVLDRAALALLFVFLLTSVLAGVLRYYAVKVHLPWLPYLPHLVLALAVLPMFFLYLIGEGVTSTFLIIFMLFGLAISYGTYNLGNADQIGFALWASAPFLFGVVILPTVLRAWNRLGPYVWTLWAFDVAGVLVNALYPWPWTGLEYQIGATQIEVSKGLTIAGLGLTRLPGFGRSVDATAIGILLLAIFLCVSLRGWRRAVVWILSGAAVVLTTHKTSVVAFVLLTLMWPLRRRVPRLLWRLIPVGAFALGASLVFLAAIGGVGWLYTPHSVIMGALFDTFVGRVTYGWPNTLKLILTHGNALLGRGLGGIDGPQLYFGPALYRHSDSTLVSLYANFGLLGVGFLCFYAWRAYRLRAEGRVAQFFFLCACTLLLVGMMSPVLNVAFGALALGASFRYLQGAASLRPKTVQSRPLSRPFAFPDDRTARRQGTIPDFI